MLEKLAVFRVLCNVFLRILHRALGYPQQSSEAYLQGETHQITDVDANWFSGLHATVFLVRASFLWEEDWVLVGSIKIFERIFAVGPESFCSAL